MKNFRYIFLFLLVCGFLTPVVNSSLSASELQDGMSKTDVIRSGEKMYREGILPSGKAMEAFIRKDVEVDSTAFSCSSCHLRAGIGSVEGGVVTPPTTGNKLYKPYRRPPSLDDVPDRAGRYIYAKTVVERPPYTRGTLATALRFGIDPAGQNFNDVMPRYPLNDRDMSILISYLESLSLVPSPGADDRGFSFATIITEDVSDDDRKALLQPLNAFITQRNNQVRMYNDFIKFGYTPTADMKYAFRQASLDIWELKGKPETWKAQLKSHYSHKPVFAILGGISNREWKPIHEFCEEERLPCLFPITDFPVLSNTGWYTYYFNKGFAQEGEAVATYLNRLETLPDETRILQIVQDSPEGNALAAGFQSKWTELEHPPVKTVKLTSDQISNDAELANLIKVDKPSILILWAAPERFHGLQSILKHDDAPKMAFLSSGYLGKKTTLIPETIRDKVYLTFPYRITPYAGPKTGGFDFKVPILTTAKDLGDRRILSRTTDVLQQSVQKGISLLYDNLYRDNLLDVMSMQMDLTVRDYERLSFGPGQRYVSKGCYIIQLGTGEDPPLLAKSEWVMH